MNKKVFSQKKDHDSEVTAAAQNFVRKKLMLKGAIQAFLTLFDLNNYGFLRSLATQKNDVLPNLILRANPTEVVLPFLLDNSNRSTSFKWTVRNVLQFVL